MANFYASYPIVGGGTSGTVTSVDVSGGTTGLTTSGGPITTSGTITIAGTLNIANGGTGQTTANAAFNALAPTTTKGDLISFSTVNARLAVGSNGQVLTADSAQTLGVKWATPTTGTVTSVDVSGGTTGLTTSGGPITSSGTITLAGTLAIANGGTGQTSAANAFNALAPTTTKGDLIAFSTTNARLPVGSNTQVLTADSTQTLGVKWATPTTGTVTSVDVSGGTTGLTTSGGPITSSGTITLAGTLAIANGGTGQTTANAAFNALAPTTTKGDLIAFSTVNARLPVGSNGTVLTADSAQTLGVKWGTASTGTVTSVDVSGGSTGLTTSGGPVTTSGTITLAGTLAIANGGTGQTSASAALTALGGVSSTLSQFNALVGNVSNVATAVQTNLTGDIKASTSSSTVTISNASPGVITWNSHGLSNGNTVYLTTSSALPTGLSANTTYYVQQASANTFQVSATFGGASINTSSAGSGTQTAFAGGFVFNSAIQRDWITLDTVALLGSTNVHVVNFTNISPAQQGANITAANSATLGSSFTINTAGLYSVALYLRALAAGVDVGITVNSTSAPQGLGPTNLLGIADGETAGTWTCCSTVAYLAVNDVIRATTSESNPSGNISTNASGHMRIVRIA